MAKTQKAQQAYQPAYQAQADQGYQSLVSSSTPYANAISSTVVPGLQQVASNVQNSPYNTRAQMGADTVSQMGPTVAAGQFQGAGQLQGLGMLGSGQAADIMGAQQGAANDALGYGKNVYADAMAMRNQLDQGGLAQAGGLLTQGISNANDIYGRAIGAIPGLTGGMGEAQTLLNNGFDPQRALYDREYQQMADQANAMNAMYGLQSSGYGAGVANQASRDFNLDWGDRQLSRQIAALGAYGQQQGQVASNLTSLLGTGANAYNALTQGAVGNYTGLTSNAANNWNSVTNTGTTALNQGFDNYNNLMNSAVNNYDQLSSAAGRNFGQASQLGIDALNTYLSSQQAPQQEYLAQQQANLAALQALASGGTQALAPTQNLINAQGEYLGIGQNATQVSNQAIAAKNAQANSTNAGIGKLVGTAAGFAIGGPQGAIMANLLM